MNTSPSSSSPLMVIPPLGSVRPSTTSGDGESHNIATSLALVPAPLQMVMSSAAPEPSSDPVKKGRGRPKGSKNGTTTKKPKVYDPNSRKVSSCPNFDSEITEENRDTGNTEIVKSVLMRYDAVRRKLCQLRIKEDVLLTALSNCKSLGVRTNEKKRIGPVPGIEVGDIFYYFGEMHLIGLHSEIFAGIGYMKNNDEDETEIPLAASVVSSGSYDDKQEDPETLIYTGQGKMGKDQVLKGGNLALVESKAKGNDVRVVIGEAYPTKKDKKIYIYDGLYTVSDYWLEERKGFQEYKFRLVRKPGQSSGYAVWKTIEKWRNGEGRKGIIDEDISCRGETIPVPVVNEVDENDKTKPEAFCYIASQYYSSDILYLSSNRQTLGCQNCQGYSCPRDSDCQCLTKNNGTLPYLNNCILVCRKPMIYECGAYCTCALDCKFKVVQNGMKIRVEVFKTEKCGWGLRSWDPIRAGTFICEFAGRNKTKQQVEDEEENDHLFDSSRVYNRFKWNYEPELVGEDCWKQVPEVFKLPYQVLISAKEFGNVGRFINHSCSPNVFWQPVQYEGEYDSYVRIGFFAKKNIPPLTELTYDYGMSYEAEEVGEDGRKLFKGKKICHCDSVECRGSFG